MSYKIAMIIACISGGIGFLTFTLVIPEVKIKTNKKYLKYICSLFGVIGIALYISYLICMNGTHLNSSIAYEEVPIKKLTREKVYFENKEYSLSESYVILEEPNIKYNNVVLIEKENYVLQWLCKIQTTNNKYHIYLSEDTYKRLKNGNVIYESEK